MAVSLEAAAPAPVGPDLHEPTTAARAASADIHAGGGAASLERGAARVLHPRSLKILVNRERERVVRRRRDGYSSAPSISLPF